MALTRSQLIAGDSSQGPVLAGQVQGVKQGNGVEIAPDGTISFKASTSSGVVKLNNPNPNTFNGYVWPITSGAADTFLGVDGNGNLSWSVPAGLVNLGPTAPTGVKLGELWFNYTEDLLYVYQDKGGTEEWKPVYRGLNPDTSSTSASPAFISGSGTEEDPYHVPLLTTRGGNTVVFSPVITITGLAPYQYIPIQDTSEELNNFRFLATDYFADGDGTLKFKIKFTDYPQTPAGEAYSALFRVGYDPYVYISAGVGITAPLSILNPGSIAGIPLVGEDLTYTTGLATGGTPPYSYTWVWKSSANDVLQENGDTYVVAPSVFGQRLFVELTATDNALDTATATTSVFPASPDLIGKGGFPNTVILFPTTTNSTASTTWLDQGTQLSASGCIEFSTDGLLFGQGPVPIANGGTITTRWIDSVDCSQAPNSTVISGCVYNDSYQECSSLTIDRVPSPFTFNPVTGIIPGAVATSQVITPFGYNSRAYVTYNGSSTGTSIEASKDGGSSWSALSPIGSTSFFIDPGNTLRVRLTTGSSNSTDYTAIINIGVNSSVQSATFTATTVASTVTIFTTPITFPTTTLEEAVSTAWLAGDGSTNLTATGCIQFKVGSGGTWTSDGDPPVAITTGDILYTRWSNSTPGVCGNAVHGTVITGAITNVPSGGTKTNTATLTIDRVPTIFAFTDLTGQATSSTVTSNTLNISGINAPTFITKGAGTLSSFEASVGGGPWNAIPDTGETLILNPVSTGPGTTLQIRGATGGSNNTSYTGIINIGQGTSIYTDTWTVATAAITPAIVTPSIVTPTNGATNLNPNNVSPPGITVTSSPYSAINGAGSHTGTDWEVYYLNPGSSTPVYIVQVTDSSTNLTSYFIPASLILPNRTYYARVRYRTTTPSPITSSWSNLSQFSTSTTFTLSFVLRYTDPYKGYYGNSANVVYQSSGEKALLMSRVVNYSVDNPLITSNGISFTRTTSPFALQDTIPFDAAFGNNKIVVVGGYPESTSNFTGVGIPSGSNISWISYASAPNLLSIAYSPSLNLFAAGGVNGIWTAPGSFTSAPVWTQRLTVNNQVFNSILWDGSSFRAPGTNQVFSSTNGTTWSGSGAINGIPSGASLGQIAYNSNSNRYCLTTNYYEGWSPNPYFSIGSTTGFYSTNGTNWTQMSFGQPVSSVAAGGNFFVASGAEFNRTAISVPQYYYSSTLRILSSTNAQNWDQVFTSTRPDYYWFYQYYYYYFYFGRCFYMPQNNRFVVPFGDLVYSSV